MNNIQIFNNAEFGQVRSVEINGEAWLVGKDVANILGYADQNKAIAMHVDDEDKLNDKTALSLGQRGGWLINESGLYSLVLSSKLPSAKRFKKWVTSEVIPSVRKNGAYMTPETIEKVLLNPDTIIDLASRLKAEQEKSRQLQQTIKEQEGAVLFAKSVEASDCTILIGELAKILKQNGYDTGQNRLFETLRKEGYLIKSGSDRNMPTQRAMELGLFKVKESTVNNADGSVRITKTVKVTGKGQQYFVNRFVKETI